jgi:protein-tyrosine phosphatase
MSVPYWIDTSGLPATPDGTTPRIAIVPCPAGGEKLRESISELRSHGIETLTSLLQAEETRILKLEEEGRACREIGIDYLWLPVTDHSIPESMEEVRLVVDRLHRDLRSGKAVGAHCYAGIGRSCLLLACVLCLDGLTPEQAFQRLSVARGLHVPDTWLQSQWVQHFADSLADPIKSPDGFQEPDAGKAAGS